MAVVGEEKNFHTKYKFVVEIDGFASAAFQSCSELSVEAAEITYYEGGAIIPDKQPGKLTVADITLSRGATLDHDAYDWFAQVGDAAQNAGLKTPQFKRNLTIVQLDRDGSAMLRWRIFGAWPKKFVVSDWDNEADEVAIEQLVLAIDRFEMKPVGL
jgi:phage tail-like protein